MQMTTEGFSPNVVWHPFNDNGLAGFECTRVDTGERTYVYLNPSSSGEGAPDVFVYVGPHCDPALDTPMVFVTPFR